MTTYVADTFTRADGNLDGSTPETSAGSNWKNSSGAGSAAWGVVSNQAKKTVAGTGENLCCVPAGVTDCTVRADITFFTASSAGLVFHTTASSGTMHTDWNGALFGSGPNVYVYTVVGGSYVEQAAVNSVLTNGVTYNVAVVLLGNSVKVYLDNVKIIDLASLTTSANDARTGYGFRSYQDTGTIFDNFIVDDQPVITPGAAPRSTISSQAVRRSSLR